MARATSQCIEAERRRDHLRNAVARHRFGEAAARLLNVLIDLHSSQQLEAFPVHHKASLALLAGIHPDNFSRVVGELVDQQVLKEEGREGADWYEFRPVTMWKAKTIVREEDFHTARNLLVDQMSSHMRRAGLDPMLPGVQWELPDSDLELVLKTIEAAAYGADTDEAVTHYGNGTGNSEEPPRGKSPFAQMREAIEVTTPAHYRNGSPLSFKEDQTKSLKDSKRCASGIQKIPKADPEELNYAPEFTSNAHFQSWCLGLEAKHGGWMGIGSKDTWAESYGGYWWKRYKEDPARFRRTWNEALTMAREQRIKESIGGAAIDLWKHNRV